jgi:serine/threonine protein phosphatase PrpC
MTCQTLFYIDRHMETVEAAQLGPGGVAVFSSRSPDRDGPNEDAAAVIPLTDTHCVLALADGFGGHPAGAQAAEIAIRQVERQVCECSPGDDNLRSAIVDGFESANTAVRELGVGAATTLAVIDIDDHLVRPYHVGDSAILVVGQRGVIKSRSVSHSPVGYAVESGLIDEEEAMNHEERHIVSNMVGSAEMRIEIGASLKLAPRDTVLVGSDGLWDNLRFEDIVKRIRKGPLDKSLAGLVAECIEQMNHPAPDSPSKPDDLTVIAYRRTVARKR